MRRDAGSIFIETMIAATLVAIVLGGFYRVMAGTAMRGHMMQDRRVALLVAQSQLAAVGYSLPLTPGESAGIAGEMSWRLTVQPYDGGGNDSSAGVLRLVTVAVGRDGQGHDLVTLRTVALAKGERP